MTVQGWDIVRLPNNRLLLRNRAAGAMEVPVEDLQRWFAQESRDTARNLEAAAASATPKQAPLALSKPKDPKSWASPRPRDARGVAREERLLERGTSRPVPKVDVVELNQPLGRAVETTVARDSVPRGARVDVNLQRRQRELEQEIYRTAEADASRKALLKNQGLSQRGGQGVGSLGDQLGELAVVRSAALHPEYDFLVEVKVKRMLSDSGKPLPESALQGLEGREPDGMFLNRERPDAFGFLELKREDHLVRSIQGGSGLKTRSLVLTTDPVLTASRFKPSSKIGEQLEKEKAIRNLPGISKLEVEGTDVRTGAKRRFVVDADSFVSRVHPVDLSIRSSLLPE